MLTDKSPGRLDALARRGSLVQFKDATRSPRNAPGCKTSGIRRGRLGLSGLHMCTVRHADKQVKADTDKQAASHHVRHQAGKEWASRRVARVL